MKAKKPAAPKVRVVSSCLSSALSPPSTHGYPHSGQHFFSLLDIKEIMCFLLVGSA